MEKISFRRAMRVSTVAMAIAAGVAVSGPAWAASGPTYNHADVTIRGGAGQALAGCINVARTLAHYHHPAQSNYCSNFAEADGGTVSLRRVPIFIDQEGNGHNHATVDIEGGSAHAVASCINYLQGTATAAQTNECSNTAVAPGGDVHMTDVEITIIQT
jgi:hypothetical protein